MPKEKGGNQGAGKREKKKEKKETINDKDMKMRKWESRENTVEERGKNQGK